MREIKFRAWIKDTKIMIEVHQIYFDSFGGYEVSNKDFESLDHLETELMQYTGLKDKNGNEIYEGDIVNYIDYDKTYEDEFLNTGEVIYNECSFVLTNRNEVDMDDIDWDRVEVLGNIYENPELLNP